MRAPQNAMNSDWIRTDNKKFRRSWVMVGGMVSLLALVNGCDRDAPDGENNEALASSHDPVLEAPCEFVRAQRLLTSLSLESEDGACVVLLPPNAVPGSFEITVSIVGRADAAAVQLPAGDGAYYYANEGTLELEQHDGARIRGQFTVSDSNPPQLGGPFRGSFDVALE